MCSLLFSSFLKCINTVKFHPHFQILYMDKFNVPADFTTIVTEIDYLTLATPFYNQEDVHYDLISYFHLLTHKFLIFLQLYVVFTCLLTI